MELGGSLFSSTSWLEFFGPMVGGVEVVMVGDVEVVTGVTGGGVEVVEVGGFGAETDT